MRSPPTSVGLGFVAFEPAFEAHLAGRGKVQGGVLNIQLLVAGREGDGLSPGGIQPVGLLLAAVHERGFDLHQRRREIGFDVRRVDRRETPGGRKPQPAIGADGGRLRAGGTFARRQAVRCAIGPAGNDIRRAVRKIGQRFFRNPHQPRVRTDPQKSRVVFNDVTDADRWQGRWPSNSGSTFRLETGPDRGRRCRPTAHRPCRRKGRKCRRRAIHFRRRGRA